MACLAMPCRTGDNETGLLSTPDGGDHLHVLSPSPAPKGRTVSVCAIEEGMLNRLDRCVCRANPAAPSVDDLPSLGHCRLGSIERGSQETISPLTNCVC